MICVLQGGGDGVDNDDNEEGLCRCGVVDTAARWRQGWDDESKSVGYRSPTKESLHFCRCGVALWRLRDESHRA